MGLVLHLARDLVDQLSGFLVGSPYDYWDYEDGGGGGEYPWPPPTLEAGLLYVVLQDNRVVMTKDAADWVVVNEALATLANPDGATLVRLTDGRYIQMEDSSLLAVLNTDIV